MSHSNHALALPDANGVWACSICSQKFIAADRQTVEKMVGQEALNTVLDGIAGTMSAVLWDYTERMHEKYGLKPLEAGPEREWDCEQDGHIREDGTCIHCGDYPFLGSDDKAGT